MPGNLDLTDDEQNAFLAAIGHICLQWALLEQMILFVIGAVENLAMQKAYKMFAGLDMNPRINMAIHLAQEAGLPHNRFVKPLIDVRKALNSGLTDRRNMFVHGVHKFGTEQGEYVLTMTRWKGDKQSQTVTLLDAVKLAHEIALQAQKAGGIFDDYGVWKFSMEGDQKGREKIAEIETRLRSIRAKNLKRGFKLILGNLKPW